MSNNNVTAESTTLFGKQYATVTSTREIKPSKKALLKDASTKSKVFYANRPVFENVSEYTTFLFDAATEADRRQPGNGVQWLDKNFASRFEDATEASLRGDGMETDDVEWQTEFINVEVGGRSLSALEKTMNDQSSSLLELALMHTSGSWKTDVDSSGALVFEDEAHYMTVLQSRSTAYTRAQQIYKAAFDHAAVKAEASRAKAKNKAAVAAV